MLRKNGKPTNMRACVLLQKASKQLAFFAIAAACVISGCQRNQGRQSISGSVTVDGRPAANAVVHFQPPAGHDGNSSGATTDVHGRFIIAADRGLLPGNYAVNIQQWEGTGQLTVDPETKRQVEITAPIDFKENGSLQASITREGPNRFEFRLTRMR